MSLYRACLLLRPFFARRNQSEARKETVGGSRIKSKTEKIQSIFAGLRFFLDENCFFLLVFRWLFFACLDRDEWSWTKATRKWLEECRLFNLSTMNQMVHVRETFPLHSRDNDLSNRRLFMVNENLMEMLRFKWHLAESFSPRWQTSWKILRLCST